MKKGTGCFIRVGTGDDDFAFDSTCTEFYVYQDHGQVPEGSWCPSLPYRETLSFVYSLGLGSSAGQSGSPFPQAEKISLPSNHN